MKYAKKMDYGLDLLNIINHKLILSDLKSSY